MEIALRAQTTRTPQPGELDPETLGFGTRFTPRMLTLHYEADQGWHDPAVVDYAPFQLDPAALVLHYAQEVFEGMKVYAWEDGQLALFRPDRNAARFNSSSRRLCIPEVDPNFFVQACEVLADVERAWVPRSPGASLYLRPVTIATEPALGVRVSRRYIFYVIASPVGPYFGDFTPVKVQVTRDFVRAAVGGIGAAKTAGNYAASLLPGRLAKEAGYDQVVYLDAKTGSTLEELGGMNVFVIKNGTLTTPPLTGSILEGVTRSSLLQLAQDRGIPCQEAHIPIDTLVQDIASGAVTEIFAAGTAAVVTAIGTLGYEGKDHVVADGQAGEVTKALFTALTDIQYGRAEDTHGWMRVVPRRHS